MKKKLAIFSVSIVCLFAACLFVACEKHVHNFGDWVTTDPESHWKVCEECGEKSEFGAHDFSEWSYNSSSHWKECICGARSESSAHVFDDDNICEICLYEKEHTHTPGDWVLNSTAHWKECTDCGFMISNSYAIHNYNANFECTVCGYKHQHSYAENLICDDVDHWYVDSCDHNTTESKQNHVFVDDVCTVCGYTRGLQYQISSDGASYSVEGIGTVKSTEIVIPSAYKTLPVTQIGENAFKDKNITSVIVPDSVVKVGDNAFENCPITKASVPTAAISYIPKDLLEEVKITSGAGIEGRAFANCNFLKTLYINSEVLSVATNAFTDSPIEVAYIPAHAISALPKNTLKDVNIVSGSIADMEFVSFEKLENVSIDVSVTSIGKNSFDYCDNIKNIYYNGSIADWCSIIFFSSYSNPLRNGAALWIGDKKIDVLEIPEEVTSINGYAFQGGDFSTVILPETLKALPFSVFENCKNLKNIVIPVSLTKINNKAFMYCSILTNIYYMGNADDWKKIEIDYNNNALNDATVYYYSQQKPQTAGNYWHYEDNVPTAW